LFPCRRFSIEFLDRYLPCVKEYPGFSNLNISVTR